MILLIDYEKIGFKCGLELHQQLDTRKLFCSCPSEISQAEPNFEIERKLIAVAGETGKIDVASKFESQKNKIMVYKGDHKTSCNVDTDSEPPHALNREALLTALQLSKLLHMKIVDEIQVMRKIITDGSVTTGFQRTSLIAKNGYVKSSLGKVAIASLILEEDSCRKLEKTDFKAIWHLDRQGIALIELSTEPDIKNAEHAKEVAMEIRRISRMVKIKRGIGTVRQDVNVSVMNGSRVEIKGVQDIRTMPKVIEKEVERQLEEKTVEACVRGAQPDGSTKFLRPMPGAARMYPETDAPPIAITGELIKKARKELPEGQEKKILFMNKLGVQKHIAEQIISQEAEDIFLKLYKNVGVDAQFIASTILAHPKKSYEELMEVLLKYKEGKISKDGVKDLLRGRSIDSNSISQEEATKKIEEIVEKNKELLSDYNAFQKLMGEAMKELRGKVDGKLIAEILKGALEKQKEV